MAIDFSIPATIQPVGNVRDSTQIQTANREVIQAVRAVNASGKLGDRNELTFSIDRRTRRPVITIVNRDTNEVVGQIPSEQILRLADDLKQADSSR
jgi:flagellar protein FlaG